MAEERHKIIIEKQDDQLTQLRKNVKESKNDVLQAAQAFGKYSVETQNAAAKLRNAEAQLKTANRTLKEFSANGKMSTMQMAEFGENLTVIGAGAMMVFQKLMQVVNVFKEMIVAGAELQVLGDNFIGTAEDIERFRVATAGTVTDANLIKLSNQATDLGLSMKEQTILMSLAETAADKYGGSVEENFQKVLYATEGNVKGLKLVGIQKAQYEELINKEVKAVQKELGLKTLTLDQLDAETKKRIQTNAVIQLSGETYETATNKVKDNKDKIESLGVTIDNYKAKIGKSLLSTFIGDLDKMTDSLKKAGVEIKKSGDDSDKNSKRLADGIRMVLGAAVPLLNFPKILTKIADGFKMFKDAVNDMHNPLGQLKSILGNSIPTPFLDAIKSAANFAYNELYALLSLLNMIDARGGVPDNIHGAKNPFPHMPGEEPATVYIPPKLDPNKTKTPKEKKDKEDKTDAEDIFLEQIRSEIELAQVQNRLTNEFIKLQADKVITESKHVEELLKSAKTDKDKLKYQKDLTSYLSFYNDLQDRIVKNNELWVKQTKIELSTLESLAKTLQSLPKDMNLNFGISAMTDRQRNKNKFQGTVSETMPSEDYWSEAADKIKSAFEQSLSLAQTITSLFGEGAGAIISAFQQAYSIIQAIVELIRTINAVSSLISLIPGGGIIGSAFQAVGAVGGNVRGMLSNSIRGNAGHTYVIVNSEIERGKGIKVFNKYGFISNVHESLRIPL